jgi:hypothetical protein
MTNAPTSPFPSSIPSSLPALTASPAEVILPTDKQARSDYRCGVTEVDARGNCGKECTPGVTSCATGEYCLSTFANYCHIKPQPHPFCPDKEYGEEIIRRCGFQELDARGYCGKDCTSSSECGTNESCFPVQRNFCDCFEKQDANSRTRRLSGTIQTTNAEYFTEAKKEISPYFLAAFDTTPVPTPVPIEGGNSAGSRTPAPTEGGSSAGSRQSRMAGLLLAGAVFAF